MRLISPIKKLHCPFCFHRFHLSEAPTRRRANHGASEPDLRIAAFLDIEPPELGPVEDDSPETAWQRAWRRCVVSDADVDRGRKVCPNCHLDLPHKIANGELQPETIAIIGARNAGKSNYLGVLLHLLKERYQHEVDFLFTPEPTFDISQQKSVLSTRLLKRRYGCLFDVQSPKTVAQTKSAEGNPDIRIPLIYRLTFRASFAGIRTKRCIDLILFDAAGEDLEQPDVVEHFYRYVSAASGIVFLLDPLELPDLEDRLEDGDSRANSRTDVDPAEVIKIVLDLFETRAGLQAHTNLRIPTAFALAKADLLDGLVHPSSLIRRDSLHECGFNVEDCAQVSEEIREHLCQWGGSTLVHEIAARFSDHAFFAVSALGQSPSEDGALEPISARRIGDPLLWIFWRLGYLSAMSS